MPRRCSPRLPPGLRRHARQRGELAAQVGVIAVAGGERDLGPALRRVAGQRQRAVETHHACVLLGAEADRAAKERDEAAVAVAAARHQPGDRRVLVGQRSECCGDGRMQPMQAGAERVDDTLGEQGFEDVQLSFEIARSVNLFERGEASMGRINELLDAKAEIVDAGSDRRLASDKSTATVQGSSEFSEKPGATAPGSSEFSSKPGATAPGCPDRPPLRPSARARSDACGRAHRRPCSARRRTRRCARW